MRYSLSLPLPTLFAFCLTMVLAVSAVAQDADDPFKSRPDQSNSDSNPFGISDSAKPSSAIELRNEQKIHALKKTLSAFTNELEDLRRDNLALKRRCDELVGESEELAQSVAEKNAMHQKIFETLLSSADKTQQLLALQHLRACLDQEGIPRDKLSLNVTKPAIFRRLSQLVNSGDDEIQLQAARVFTSISRESAIKLGFQFGPVWEPTSHFDSAQEVTIYEALRETTQVDYEQTPLWEVIEEWQQRNRFSIVLSKEVNGQTLITHKANGQQIGGVLERMLDKNDLAYRVMEDHMLIMNKADPRVQKPETYNIRGLLSESLDIDGLIKLIEREFDAKSVSIDAVDKHKLVFRGTESDHRKISEFLGALADSEK